MMRGRRGSRSWSVWKFDRFALLVLFKEGFPVRRPNPRTSRNEAANRASLTPRPDNPDVRSSPELEQFNGRAHDRLAGFLQRSSWPGLCRASFAPLVCVSSIAVACSFPCLSCHPCLPCSLLFSDCTLDQSQSPRNNATTNAPDPITREAGSRERSCRSFDCDQSSPSRGIFGAIEL